MRTILFILFSFCGMFAIAQYAPPAGIPGSTAIHKDSSVFRAWVKSAEIYRASVDISDPTSPLAGVGDSSSCVGKSNGQLVSLGDGGEAILIFDLPVFDGPSWDFAVFENSFLNDFLELAFVEVSSDGQNFYRFPASSLTQDSIQVGSFGTLDARKINNLAGKYEAGYGTPFDLAEMAGIPGLDIQNISHIKIIDVIGSINPLYGSRDSSGNYVNDPWPTPFPSSGFDLESLGVIHSKGFSIDEFPLKLTLYPNPSTNFLTIENTDLREGLTSIQFYNLQGNLLLKRSLSEFIRTQKIDISLLKSGIYFVVIRKKENVFTQKIQILK